MLYLYYSNSQERLARAFAELPVDADDPFRAELVLVQNQDMALWLTERLAARRGICANVEYLMPAEFGWRLFREMRPQLPERSQFDREVLLWRVMRELPRCGDEPALAPLRHYLGDAAPIERCHQLARRITDVYDQYLIYRPDWLLAWERGELCTQDPQEPWQAALWRRLTAGVDEPHRGQLWQEFMETGDLEPTLAALPPQLAVFGISNLAPVYIDLLRRVAQTRDVHFFWLNPCEEYWADIVSARTRDRFERYWRKLGKPLPDAPLEEGNPLLASLGRLGRDAFALHWNRLLDGVASEDGAAFPAPEGGHCLALLQRDILKLRRHPPEARPSLALDDDSVSVHACHSPMREVQALYDELLRRFGADQSLTPREVLVMTPDIETYAPYIHAVFGAAEEPTRRIPYTIADRTLRAESALVQGFLTLLECERGRFAAPDMYELLQSAPVRARFSIAADELPRIEHWLREAGVRWGLDAADRARHGLPGTADGTWETALKRLLLGYALPLQERALFHDYLPFDDIEGGDAESAGKLLDFFEALQSLAATLRAPRPLGEWVQALAELLERFFAPQAEAVDDLYLIHSALAELHEQARVAGYAEPVSAATVRQHLSAALTQRRRGGSFLAGTVTFAGMVPMRALPFRFIAVLGLNDNDYPRRPQDSGFDLMAKDYRPGDRVHRDEDRYLFLEALLSAQDALYLSYVGRDIRDNTETQPSVILSELLDYLVDHYEVAGVAEADAERRRERLLEHWVRRHPLQPFGARYFSAGDRLRSHSARSCAIAGVLAGVRTFALEDFFDARLPAAEDEWRRLTVEQLLRFFRHPLRFLLGERLGIKPTELRTLSDREVFELNALDETMLRARLVEEHRAMADLAERLAVHRARGVLPPGQMGSHLYDKLVAECEGFASRLEALAPGPVGEPLRLELELDSPHGIFHLSGLLDGVAASGRIDYRFASMKARDWLDFWIKHLAFQLCCGGDAGAPSYWLAKDKTLGLAPLAPERARRHLEELLCLYWEGLQAPLPLFPQTAYCYVEALLAGLEPGAALEKAREQAWESELLPESDDALLRFVYRDRDPLDDAFRAAADRVFRPMFDCHRAMREVEA